MAKRDPLQIGSDLLLLHEGTTDLKVIGKLMRNFRIEGYQPIEVGGQSRLRALLKALVLAPHFKNPIPGIGNPVRAMAVVLDAEADANSTFRSICDSLAAADLPAPEKAGSISQHPLKVGVFLVPDNRSPGKIEDLCLESVCKDPVWACLDPFFKCVSERGAQLPENMAKARAQAFLATRKNPALPVGLAADEGYWQFEHEGFKNLAAFLQAVAEN